LSNCLHSHPQTFKIQRGVSLRGFPVENTKQQGEAVSKLKRSKMILNFVNYDIIHIQRLQNATVIIFIFCGLVSSDRSVVV